MLETAFCLGLVDIGGKALELMLEVSLERGTGAGRRGKAQCFTRQHVNKSIFRKTTGDEWAQRGLLRCVGTMSFWLYMLPTHNSQLLPLALFPSATGIFLYR